MVKIATTQVAYGGTLKLVMGATPNKSWGSDVKNAPPSALQLIPSDIK